MKPRWMTSTGRLVGVAVSRLVRFFDSWFMAWRRDSESDSFGIHIVRTASDDFLNGPKLYASLTNTGGEIRLNASGLNRTERHGNHKEHPVLLIARLKPIKRLLWFVCGLKSPSVVNLYIRWRSGKRLARCGQCLSPECQSDSIPPVWVPPSNEDYSKLLQAVSDTAKTTPPIGEYLPACGNVLETQRDTGLGVQIFGDKEDSLAPFGDIPERRVDDRVSSHDESLIFIELSSSD
jgi:hypothetical protein